MELKNQVVSLDLAKKMKELGFEQESIFRWVCRKNGKISLKFSRSVFMDNQWEISAYTVAELGEIGKRGKIGITAYSEMTKHWWVTGGEWIVEKQKYSHLEEGEKWADVLAKMLIYLKEQKLI